MKSSEIRIGNSIRCVKDYRIGNFVLDEDGEICKIEQLSSDKMGVFQQVSPIENITCISSKYPSNVYAIPLTEEWLLKFGAKKTDYEIPEYHYDRFALDYSSERHLWIITDIDSCTYMTKIEFVHEFENFIYITNGEELEIKNSTMKANFNKTDMTENMR